MHSLVLFILMVVSVFSLPLNSFAEENKDAPTYRLEILVHSGKGRLVEISDSKERIVEKFPIWGAQLRFDKDVPYGKEIPISSVVLNPPWTPTPSMISDQQKKLKKGQHIPRWQIYRKYKPGEAGNPLGKMAFYPDEKYLHAPIRLHGSPDIPEPEIDEYGDLHGKRISKGCTRVQLANLLRISSRLCEKDVEELVDEIQNGKLKKLELVYPLKITFIKG